MTVEAYPLQWPEGWPRTEAWRREKNSQFKVTVGKAIEELYSELERLGAKNVVMSSNLSLTQAMRPYAKQEKINDPGIAVYFTLKGKQLVMARDLYQDWRDNIRSLGLAVDAFRSLHRHGGAHMMERAFTGFTAIEHSPSTKRPWREVLNCANDERNLNAVKENYRRAASKHHEDKPGGSKEKMIEINLAWEEAQRELG